MHVLRHRGSCSSSFNNKHYNCLEVSLESPFSDILKLLSSISLVESFASSIASEISWQFFRNLLFFAYGLACVSLPVTLLDTFFACDLSCASLLCFFLMNEKTDKKNENKEVAVDKFLPASTAYEAIQHSMYGTLYDILCFFVVPLIKKCCGLTN